MRHSWYPLTIQLIKTFNSISLELTGNNGSPRSPPAPRQKHQPMKITHAISDYRMLRGMSTSPLGPSDKGKFNCNSLFTLSTSEPQWLFSSWIYAAIPGSQRLSFDISFFYFDFCDAKHSLRLRCRRIKGRGWGKRKRILHVTRQLQREVLLNVRRLDFSAQIFLKHYLRRK